MSIFSQGEVPGVLPITKFDAGDVIFCEGDAPDAVYAIVSGKVTISKEGRLLATLGRDDVFGDMALVDNAPRSATAIATEDTECYVIDVARFNRLMSNVDPVLMGMFKVLVARLRMMTQIVTLS